MKRGFCLVLIVMICLLVPVTVYAENYSISDTDLSIQIDDSIWYVFTRDNIENNPELEELGITYEKMHSILYDNVAYMDAILIVDDEDYVEFSIRKTAQTTEVIDLSSYSDTEVLKFATALAEQQNAKVYSIHKNQYKFAQLEYFDSKAELYVYEFCTIVNNKNYTFTFQSPSAFSEERKQIAEEIIDSAQFDVYSSSEKSKTGGNSVIYNAFIGAISGGVIGGVVALMKRKKSKKTNDY